MWYSVSKCCEDLEREGYWNEKQDSTTPLYSSWTSMLSLYVNTENCSSLQKLPAHKSNDLMNALCVLTDSKIIIIIFLFIIVCSRHYLFIFTFLFITGVVFI